METEYDRKEREAVEELLPLFTSGPFGNRRINVVYDKPIAHKHYCLPAGHLGIRITGTTSSGKSTVLLSLLPLIELSQVIILTCIPLEVNKAYQAIQRYCEETKTESGEPLDFAIAYDPASAIKTINEFCEKKPPNTKGIIIVDDFNNQQGGTRDKYGAISAIVGAQYRNMGYHSAHIIQATQGISTSVRNNTNVILYFNMCEVFAIRIAKADALQSGIIKNGEDWDALFEIVQRNKYAFLMLDKERGKLFICTGADRPIQEVEFCNDSSNEDDIATKIVADPHFQKIKEDYEQCVKNATDANVSGTMSRDPLAKMRLKRMKKNIEYFISFVANKYSLNESKVREYVHESLGL